MGDKSNDSTSQNTEDREARDIMRGIQEGQERVANVLQQLTIAIQQLNAATQRPPQPSRWWQYNWIPSW
ncbi:hypothetical protein SUGI_1095130 [Cryptomeria japonica]|nr:hypothetical protein SUGI_1095130 [Cryptomeria japonica]